MKRTLTFLLIVAGLAALFAGCSSGPTTLPNTVMIADVQSTRSPDSEYTAYKVKVYYALRSTDRGVVMIGFDLEEPGRYILLGEQNVAGGVGEVEVFADVRLPKRDTVTLYVNLSEEDHPDEWTPLAETSRLLTIGK